MKQESVYGQIAYLVDSGLTLSEMGEEVNRTAEQVRHALNRRGLKAVRENEKRLRQRVEGMRPTEAVEFLLMCVENLSPYLCGAENHAVDSWGITMTPLERRLLICIHDGLGGIVSRDLLMSAMYFDRIGDIPESKILDVLLCRLRPRIPAERGYIETVWGVGWRWVPA
jgi:hypothetical protein